MPYERRPGPYQQSDRLQQGLADGTKREDFYPGNAAYTPVKPDRMYYISDGQHL